MPWALSLVMLSAVAGPAPDAKVVTTPELRAIFSRDLASEKWGFMFRAPITFWTPAVADVEKLEAALPKYLRDTLDRKAATLKKAAKLARRKKLPEPDGDVMGVGLWKKVAGYHRQYVGLVRDGRRVVYANFFCSGDHASWRKSPVEVDDGGDCYFQVEYDLDSGKFANLSVNGEA